MEEAAVVAEAAVVVLQEARQRLLHGHAVIAHS